MKKTIKKGYLVRVTGDKNFIISDVYMNKNNAEVVASGRNLSGGVHEVVEVIIII